MPRLRFWADEGGFRPALPQLAELGDDGQWLVGGVAREYAALEPIAERLLDAMLKAPLEQAPHLTLVEALDAAAALLAVNYRVSKIELVMLGVLATDQSLMDLCRAAVDYDQAVAYVEKKSAAGVS